MPDLVIQDPRHCDVIRHVLPRVGRIREERRRQNMIWVDIVLGREFAMRLEETDAKPEGRFRLRADKVGGGDMRMLALFGQNHVITDILRATVISPPGKVLSAGQRGCITRRLERVNDMLLEIAQAKVAIGQPQHAGAVRRLPGQQGGAAGRAGGRGAVGSAEKQARFSQALQVGRWDGVAIRLQVAPGVVRVDVEDVGLGHVRSP